MRCADAMHLVMPLPCFLVAAPVGANIALPSDLPKSHDEGAKPEVACRRAGEVLQLYLHRPGPCEYFHAEARP